MPSKQSKSQPRNAKNSQSRDNDPAKTSTSTDTSPIDASSTSSTSSPTIPPLPRSHPNPPPIYPYLADPIFPTGEVHLWSGSTGVGKSPLLMQTIADWQDGKPIFGCKSYPVPFCYLACERTLATAKATLERLQIDPQRFPAASTADNGIILLDKAIELALDREPQAKVVFLDGASALLKGDPNKYATVSEFFLQAQALSKRHSLTIVAVTCSAKVKEGERYLSPRQRVSGSLAWGSNASTVVIMEAERPDDPSDLRRKVHILPVNSYPRLLHYSLDRKTGMFLIAPDELENPNEFEDVVFAREPGEVIRTGEMWEICEMLGLSRATMYRYIGKLAEDGRLEKLREGLYRITVLQ